MIKIKKQNIFLYILFYNIITGLLHSLVVKGLGTLVLNYERLWLKYNAYFFSSLINPTSIGDEIIVADNYLVTIKSGKLVGSKGS